MEYEIKPVHSLKIDLKELWEYRELIVIFTWRDLKIKYKQTVLGAVWVLLQPFLLMVVFTFFFSRALKIDAGSLPYPVFAYSGLMLWNLFSNGINNASNSLVSHANIIKKIYFPRLIIPFSTILSSLFDFLMTFILFLALLLYYPTQFSILRFLIAFPLGLLITFLTTLGLGCVFSAVNVKYRDFRYVIPFMLQMLLFLTPVIYPLNILPAGWLRDLLELNPMMGAIETFRASFQQTPFDEGLILRSLLLGLLICVGGIAYFRKTEYYFADLA